MKKEETLFDKGFKFSFGFWIGTICLIPLFMFAAFVVSVVFVALLG